MYGTTSVPRKWECADLRNVFVGTGELKTHCTGAWMSRSARTRADCETVMRLTIWPGSNASPSASSNSKPTRKALPCDAEWPAGILTTSRKSLVFQRLSMRLPWATAPQVEERLPISLYRHHAILGHRAVLAAGRRKVRDPAPIAQGKSTPAV